jgi:tetratricopeptide (TPR) repeat protein|eukprot:COSAG06_NODE_1258_length_10078_cov_2.895280_7_plen_456_part_00
MADSEPEPQSIDTDGLVCWVCQFVDCEGHPEEPLLSTGCACCRPGSSGGWAHVSCLAGAAVHQDKLWLTCPTCKQYFRGAVSLGLSRANWERCRERPEADVERWQALTSLANALADSRDLAAALPLFEELVGLGRRECAEAGLPTDEDPKTLMSIATLGSLLVDMGRLTEAQPLLEEALAGLRQLKQFEDNTTHIDVTARAMFNLANLHNTLNATAKSRLLFEESVALSRRKLRAQPNTLNAMGWLASITTNTGDCTAGLALREEVAASCLRELGSQHPSTHAQAFHLAKMRQQVAHYPSGTRALVTLVGLIPELDGSQVPVVGFKVGTGRYSVVVEEPQGPMNVSYTYELEPAKLIFNEASAVIVHGLEAAPEWNGKRGLVESYDAAKGRYRLLMKGRMKALSVKQACCKLEFAVEQERQEHVATRRARVEANVRAALAARESEAEAEAKSTGK